MSDCSKGWTNRCPAAKGKRCTCRCGGDNHGKTHQGVTLPPAETVDSLNEAMQLLNATPAPQMATYRGFTSFRTGRTVFKDGSPLSHEKSLKVENHSPTGFSWGYAGSGPAQLALALLLEETDRKTAENLHQRFKFDVVAGLGEEWELTAEQIQRWLKDHVKGETS